MLRPVCHACVPRLPKDADPRQRAQPKETGCVSHAALMIFARATNAPKARPFSKGCVTRHLPPRQTKTTRSLVEAERRHTTSSISTPHTVSRPHRAWSASPDVVQPVAKSTVYSRSSVVGRNGFQSFNDPSGLLAGASVLEALRAHARAWGREAHKLSGPSIMM